ncbi:MAG: outer membrane beta-barrel protein [bacterium]|nr:outer membrane beta-barrel protein [bacterium]
MASEKRAVGIFMIAVAVFVFVFGMCSDVQAQDDKRGLIYFKMGGNSKIDSSDLDAKFNLGFGGAYQFVPKVPLLLDVSLTMNMPYNEVIYDYGEPLAFSTKTMLVDVNGTYVPFKKKISPYITGGIGFLRNSAGLSDGYSNYGLDSSTFFTKNVGAGLRMRVFGSVFVGVDSRYYWADQTNFKTYGGTVGIAF